MRSPKRAHDRTSFFKYMPSPTAKIVLGNSSLRWSSPVLFNDPFDVPREMSFGLTPEDIVRAISRRISKLIESPPENTADMEPQLQLIVEAVRRGVPPEVKEEMLASLREDETAFRPSGESLEALRFMWRNLLPDLRILCLTESPAHAAMWLHYAAQYTGAVLEFACDDHLDSAWLAARLVEYPDRKPAVYTADGWASLLCKSKEVAIREILQVATHTKSPDWSYEKEWRITSKKRPGDAGLFTDYKFHPEELIGVYIGPMASMSDRREIHSLAQSYPRARVYNVTVGMTREFGFYDAEA
jgi:hypothetical protein